MTEPLQIAFNNLKEVVEQEVTTRWRPVKDQQPKMGERVLVLTKEKKTYCFTYDGVFFEDHTHWMRIVLPSPPVLPSLRGLL